MHVARTANEPARHSPRVLAAVVLAAALCGAAIPFVPFLQEAAPRAALQLVFSATCTLVALQGIIACRSAFARGDGLRGLGRVVFAAGLLIAVALPGGQLLTGDRLSVLAKLGFESGNPEAEVARAYVLFLAALVAFIVGEQIVSAAAARQRHDSDPARGFVNLLQQPATYWMLVAIGIVAIALLPAQTRSETLAIRGQAEGQGAASLLRYTVPVAIALGVISSHWGSKLMAAVSTGLFLAVVIDGGTRTPLLVIGIAVLLRLFVRSSARGRAVPAALALLLVLYASAVLLVGISSWRGDITEGRPASLSAELLEASTNPLVKLTEGGLDTLDGLILVTRVESTGLDVPLWDPLKAFSTFVPRSVWPDKPDFLGPEVTRAYTRFGGNAGIFLSGPGYAYLVFRGTTGMLVAFVLLGATVEALLRTSRRLTILTVLLAYGLLRFLFAGDAFDVHHTLTLVLVLTIGAACGRALQVILPRRASAG